MITVNGLSSGRRREGGLAHSCKGWPAVAIAVAVCTPTIVVATLRQVTTARARFSSRTAASIASISAVCRSTRPSLGPSSLPWSRLGLPPRTSGSRTRSRFEAVAARGRARRASLSRRRSRPTGARSLERDWEKRLRALETAKIEPERRETERPRVISQAGRDRLLALGPDLL